MRTLGAKRVKVKIGPYWETPDLHILLTKEDDAVVARCLDFTVSSHGYDEEQAIEALAEAIGEYILSAIENDSIEQINDPAHGKYWRMFNEAVTRDTGKGRHPKFLDPESKRSYPVKSHGKNTVILAYALEDLIKKFDLPGDIFEN